MTAGAPLASLLDVALVPHGFVRVRGGSRWHRTVAAREQVVGEPVAALYALHGPDGWAAAHGARCCAAALTWFERIRTTGEVLAQVRVEYQAAMTGKT